MVVPVGHNQLTFRIELERVRSPELARARSCFANRPEELSVFVEDRDSSHQIRIGHVRMAFGDIHVTVARIGYHVGGLGQGLRRVTPHAGFPQRHENLALRAELDDNASFILFAGELLEVIRARSSRIGHPYIAVSIDMDAMWPHEHAAAKAADLLA